MEWTDYFEKWPTPVMHMVFFRKELGDNCPLKKLKATSKPVFNRILFWGFITISLTLESSNVTL